MTSPTAQALAEEAKAPSYRSLLQGALVEVLDAAHAPGEVGEPSRTLAECEAKRRVIAAALEGLDQYQMGTMKFLRILLALALPYSDHPAYREEWRP